MTPISSALAKVFSPLYEEKERDIWGNGSVISALAIPIITKSIPAQVFSSLLLFLIALSSARVFPINWKKIAIVVGSSALVGTGVGILGGGFVSGLFVAGFVSTLVAPIFDALHSNSREKDRLLVTLLTSSALSMGLGYFTHVSSYVKTQFCEQNSLCYSISNGWTNLLAAATLLSIAHAAYTAFLLKK